jgi:lysine 2,3-aminomutase
MERSRADSAAAPAGSRELGTTAADAQPSSVEWNDWRWQMRRRISTVEELGRYLHLSEAERAQIRAAGAQYRWSITPYYASLMDRDDPACPLRLQQVPSAQELEDELGLPDPLAELDNSPVDAVVHVYPDRVAFKITNVCPTYCRYCFREYFVGNHDEHHTRGKLQEGIDYIARTPAIRDVLVTGGDPFLFSDERLDDLLGRLRAIHHVEIIRFGTRTPCTLPQRITPELCRLLARHHPLWLNTHFNHPRELTAEAARACDLLLRAGIPLGNQTVLLQGVNDDVEVMRALIHGLLRMRVRPYYIFQCQLLGGTAHLRTSIERGLEIMQGLRGHTTGFGVPTYVLDTPYGKVPLAPQYLLGRAGDEVVVRTWDGHLWREPNPLNGQRPAVSLPPVRSETCAAAATPRHPFPAAAAAAAAG